MLLLSLCKFISWGIIYQIDNCICINTSVVAVCVGLVRNVNNGKISLPTGPGGELNSGPRPP